MSKSLWDFVPIIADVAATLTGNPELIPAIHAGYSGITTGVQTGDPLRGLEAGAIGGATAYAGNAVGSELGSNAFGNTSLGNLTSSAQNAFEDSTGLAFGSTIGGALGTQAGGAVGDSVTNSLNPTQPDLGGTGVPGFSPSKQPSMGLPQSLSQFGSLDPTQQATNIASKGVYGGGNGPDEQNYFLNLINRQLFDPSGNVAANTNNLAPVDMSYLNQLGISGSTPTDYLKGISQYGT